MLIWIFKPVSTCVHICLHRVTSTHVIIFLKTMYKIIFIAYVNGIYVVCEKIEIFPIRNAPYVLLLRKVHTIKLIEHKHKVTSKLDLSRIARAFSHIKVRFSLPYISCFTMASLEAELLPISHWCAGFLSNHISSHMSHAIARGNVLPFKFPALWGPFLNIPSQLLQCSQLSSLPEPSLG